MIPPRLLTGVATERPFLTLSTIEVMEEQLGSGTGSTVEMMDVDILALVGQKPMGTIYVYGNIK